MSSNPLVVITRQEPEAGKIAQSLETRGINCLVEPLFSVHLMLDNVASLQSALEDMPQAIIVTSRNAIQALAQMSQQRHIRLLVISQESAEYTKQFGFTNLDFAKGDVNSLLALIENNYNPENGTLLYVRGSEISMDIAAIMKRSGFLTQEVIVYTIKPISLMSSTLQEAFYHRQIDLVAFFSVNTVKTYIRLIKKYHLEHFHSALTALCISEKVEKAAQVLTWKQCITSKKPNKESMLQEIYNFNSGSTILE